MTVHDLYRTLRFWAIAGLPSWGILMLMKYLGFIGPHSFDFSSYSGLGLIVVMAVSSYSMLASGTAIVDATVIRVVDHSQALLDTRYQLIVNATQAFPNFPLFVMSSCSHAIGEHLDVGVKVTNLLGGNKPV